MRKPRYFCENCGAEVGREQTVCPVCGRFFSSVKCPKCGYSGDPGLFRKGCPICGYSAPSGEPAAPSRRNSPPSGPLPVWIYLLSLAALVIALIGFLLAAR